ncbi:mycothiol transferase [Tsukamurella sp. 8F]|uniref:mycothiol transferase n=1 Tax=unclassified Tsukamurella TaxID=2633480 RepID=UPI0023B908BF|nr:MULTISPECIES: mycothiol transferase [unclassified Tsukamurella]MDF0531192.1 mycothiol transferase [Tsukamurella sp. 8J]MDF0585861.1 mycothiol transferase [Tsukamurella sp. 8F]
MSSRELLRDAFTRLVEHAEAVTSGLEPDVADFRPAPHANSIAWLVWHSARVQDAQVADVAGVEQVWTAQGWAARFALDLPTDATGYGQSADEAARVHAPAELLSGYYRDVHELTLRYVETVTGDELARIVDAAWDPPVTAAVRLVSIVDDCAQHLGTAAYLRGVARELHMA